MKTFGILFSAFAVAYRYAVWLQRPPTAIYARRGWTMFETIDRVYDASKAMRRLGFVCRTGFREILEQLEGGVATSRSAFMSGPGGPRPEDGRSNP